MNVFKKILMVIVILLIIAGIGYISYGYYKKLTMEVKNPIATMEIQDFGTITLELYPDQAPNTVANFIALANNGFYNGLTFHRTIPEFMIQGGDISGDGTGSPTLSWIDSSIEKNSSADTSYAIKGEFTANGYNKNTIKFEKGVLAMARSDYSSVSSTLTEQGYNSAGSQFFIMNADNTSLNGTYAAFGKVTEGLDIVDKIANVEVVTRDENAETGLDKPVTPPVITSISVETYGVDYGKPDTVEPFNYYNWLMQNYYSSSSSSSN